MPHQCVHCGKVYPDACEELLKGCSCGSHFFFYIKKEKFDELKKKNIKKIEFKDVEDKKQVEKDVREMIGVEDESIRICENNRAW